jgi:lysophospholipase L1-like esterase
MAGVNGLKADCWRWVRATWVPFVAFAVALVVVTVAAYQQNKWIAVGTGVLLAAASIALNHVVRMERRRADYDSRRARLVITAGQLGLGFVLVIVSRAGGPDALGMIGLGLVIISGGAFVSEARRSRWREQTRGPVVLGAAFVLSSVAVILLPAGGQLRLIGIALLMALLGAEFYSEDHLRARHRWGRRPVAGAGIVMVLVAAGLLIAGGASTPPALILIGVIGLVVLMTAADSDSLLLLLVVVIAALWAGAPRPAGHGADLEPAANDSYVLVLGDSYISGEGASAYYDGTNKVDPNADFTNECRRAPTAWPNVLARTGVPQVPSHVLFLACSGAEARHIRISAPTDDHNQQNGPAELLDYEQKRAELGLQKKPDFVLLSLGGNDAGFGTIGQTCVGPGDCAEVGHEFLDGLANVEGLLDQSYADIKTVVGADVPVVVTGYPIPITESGPCADVLLTDHERRFVVTFVKQLNEVVKSAATRAGFDYIDTMQDAFITANNLLCQRLNPVGMNFIGFNPKAGSLWDSLMPSNWFHNSLHPNEAGHIAMANAAGKWFAEHPTRHAPEVASDPRYAVPNIDKLFEFGFTKLCDPHGDRSCDIEQSGWADDQTLRLVQSALLPLTLAIIGSWMLAMWPIGWAFEKNVTTVSLLMRAVTWVRRHLPRRQA